MSSKLRMLALLCSVGLVATACGGGNSDEDLIAAVEASMEGDVDSFEGIDFDSRCGAESLVNAMGGAERAEADYGVTVETVESDTEFDVDLSQPDAEAFVDSFWECGDMMAAMTTGLAEEGGITEEDAACIAENMDADVFKTSLVAEFMGDAGQALADSAGEETFNAIFAAMGACDIDLGSLGG